MTLVFTILILVSLYSLKVILKVNSENSPVENLSNTIKNVRPLKTISSIVELESINLEGRHLTSSETTLSKAKIVLVNNLLSLCILMTIIPSYVMNIMVFLEDSNCDKDLMVYGTILGRISLISTVCRPFFVVKKLSQF